MENRIQTTAQEIADLDEGSRRMIESGWDIHSGPITEKDISTHEFNMMGNRIFKKLKEVDHEKNMDR